MTSFRPHYQLPLPVKKAITEAKLGQRQWKRCSKQYFFPFKFLLKFCFVAFDAPSLARRIPPDLCLPIWSRYLALLTSSPWIFRILCVYFFYNFSFWVRQFFQGFLFLKSFGVQQDRWEKLIFGVCDFLKYTKKITIFIVEETWKSIFSPLIIMSVHFEPVLRIRHILVIKLSFYPVFGPFLKTINWTIRFLNWR